MSDDFEGKFSLIYCDSDLAESHSGNDCPDPAVYKTQKPSVSTVPHEILLDEYEMTGIWNVEFKSSPRSGIVEVVCVCVCAWCFILTDHLLRRTVRRESLKQTFRIDSCVGGRFPWGLQMGTV